MDLKRQLTPRASLFKGKVNKYTFLGLFISITSIIVATFLVSYQMTDHMNLHGFVMAQKTNPAIWALDLTPFMFAYWGQSFFYSLAHEMESLIENKTRELKNKSNDLELKLKFESNHDNLTNLPNSRLFSQRVKEGIKQLRTNEKLVVILISIKNFKDINYNFGNFTGNSLLIQFAEKLKSILLQPYMLQAYMGMNMVARMYGAEFALLIPRLKKEHQFEVIIQNLVQETTANFMVDGNNFDLSTSIGIAIYPEHGKSEELLIHHATLGLYEAEKNNQAFAIYKASMESEDKSRQHLIKDITTAIEKEEIALLYNPIVDLTSNKIIGFEPMIHFEQSGSEIIHAEKLITLIEGTHLVKQLNFMILKKAIAQLALFHETNQDVFLQVHLFSATDPELPSILEDLLQQHHLRAEFVKIELTEKSLLSDQKNALEILNQLVRIGSKIVISDFATGYSSFAYLVNFPIHEIKIDQYFTMNMMKDKKRYKLVSAIMKVAMELELTILAEGIHEERVLKALEKLGCHYGQGPLLAPIMDSEELVQKI